MLLLQEDDTKIWDENSDPLEDFKESQEEPNTEQYDLISAIFNTIIRFQMIQFISDAAIESWLSLLQKILEMIISYLKSSVLQERIAVFPATLYRACKMIVSDRDPCDKFVACNKCDSIYHYEEALRVHNGKAFFI